MRLYLGSRRHRLARKAHPRKCSRPLPRSGIPTLKRWKNWSRLGVFQTKGRGSRSSLPLLRSPLVWLVALRNTPGPCTRRHKANISAGWRHCTQCCLFFEESSCIFVRAWTDTGAHSTDCTTTTATSVATRLLVTRVLFFFMASYTSTGLGVMSTGHAPVNRCTTWVSWTATCVKSSVRTTTTTATTTTTTLFPQNRTHVGVQNHVTGFGLDFLWPPFLC